MSLKDGIKSRALLLAIALGLCLHAPAQTRQEPPRLPAPEPEEEVVRITTELVQTDVAVFDKRGRFVDDLRPEDFELQVNGRTQAVAFFERVRAGSRSEEAQLAAATSRARAAPTGRPRRTSRPAPSPRGGSSSSSWTTCT